MTVAKVVPLLHYSLDATPPQHFHRAWYDACRRRQSFVMVSRFPKRVGTGNASNGTLVVVDGPPLLLLDPQSSQLAGTNNVSTYGTK